jgi:hypothetical protein
MVELLSLYIRGGSVLGMTSNRRLGAPAEVTGEHPGGRLLGT